MKKALLLILLAQTLLCAAQHSSLNPQPQKLNLSTIIPKEDFRLKIQHKPTDNPSAKLLEQLCSETSGKQNVNIWVGTQHDRKLRKWASKVPQKAEGYYIHITPKNIYIVGYDKRGTYYGVRTLQQLIANNCLAEGEITDFPDIAYRGVVEGFYGTPWSHEKRLRQIHFYGQHKLNTYIYGPKDDPYHSSPNWRLPYPSEDAEQLKELVNTAKEHHVDFVWAIHPGKDIQWNEEDRGLLLQKFEWMYELGVRAFAVFFDDISGEGTNPQKQAELLNFIHQKFISQKPDVSPLIMCPTEYNKAWSNPKGKYLTTLGTELHPSIEIMWTGNSVVADIDRPTLEWINNRIHRKAYIWWNFPVSDYVRDHMLLGPVYGNALDIQDGMSGFVSNPMEHPEASKIAIYGVANYTWNMAAFDSQNSWKNAINEVLPEHKDALMLFASHNSDLGPNGHRYRRTESVDFTPIAQQFIQQLDAPQNSLANIVYKEFENIIRANDELLRNKESNPYLLEELHPWLLQFREQGELGKATLQMYSALQQNNPQLFEENYRQVLFIQKKMFDIDQTYNQNPFQPGVKTGTLVLEPLIEKTLSYSINTYNQHYGKNLQIAINFNPNTLITNIKQLSSQPLRQKGKQVRITPSLEYILCQTGNFIGISFEQEGTLRNLNIDVEKELLSEICTIEYYSTSGEWKPLQGQMRGTRWSTTEHPETVKSIRLRIISENPVELKLKQFEATVTP